MAKASTRKPEQKMEEKQAVKEPEATPKVENAVATTTTGNHHAPSAEMMERMMADAGKGVSSAPEDNIVPLVYILQPLSPQLQRSKPNFIEGAIAGDIFLRNAGNPIVKGNEGIIFQHCYFMREFVEWVPRIRGGGFVTKYKEIPKDAKEVADQKNPNRPPHIIRPNGNEVIDTRYHIGYVHRGSERIPYVIPFASTGHGVSRSWMFAMNSKRLPNGAVMPGYGSLWLLKTIERSNVSGTWYVFNPIDNGYVQSAFDYDLGSKLYASFEAGEKEVENPEVNIEVQTTGGGDNQAM